MATSGTTSFTLDLSDIMEEAYERAGLELRSGYDYKTARRSLDLLMLEWQNRGLNLWTVRNTSQALTAGTSSYDLSADKLDIIEGLLRTDAGNTSKQSDLTMQRISVSQYAHQTNKLTQGRPLQYYVERKPTGVTVHFWPVPDATQSYTFEYYYMERIEDTGSPASNNMDVPARFLPCLVSGLAYQIASKRPESMQMAPMLKQVYEEQWSLAADSAREKAALYMAPGGYNDL
jgi:hypothetical protein|tara:strand:- start:10908 stop:11603 length:696 start_codon:yes stop_codon:yes gene_type:complete